MTPQEIAVRLRAGGAALAFDTNALFGERSLFDVCNSVARYNERLATRGLSPLRLVVSAVAHAEKVFDLKQQFRDRFDAGVILRGLARKGLTVTAFDAQHALETAVRIGERHTDSASWHAAKRVRYLECLGLPPRNAHSWYRPKLRRYGRLAHRRPCSRGRLHPGDRRQGSRVQGHRRAGEARCAGGGASRAPRGGVMRRIRLPRAQRCIVVALELLPREDSPTPADMRVPLALRDAEGWLMRETRKSLGRRLVCIDRQLVVTTPIETGKALLFNELIDIGGLQTELLKHDIVLRGALTIGETRDDFVAGPGIFAAHRLRDLADVPRVIIDPRALVEVEDDERLRAPYHEFMEELGYIRRLLRQDSDSAWYVDYLANEYRAVPGETALFHTHCAIVEARLDSAPALTRTSRSWTWLWCYHNTVLEDLHAEGLLDDTSRRELHIPAKGPLVYAFPEVGPPFGRPAGGRGPTRVG